ncbi:hypothetical protein [Streptomyces palmae]|uniref:Uncharacterized protein n=1 Tax=Streptomyces palmae TaxID=1701085 RepID=A0A4Z0GM09_9ACTN|nr:hypothetical protein [Streptomyces palmae]TGA98056.1 hypothetical protein E4099_23195 [Streptomyces palmae]
MSSRKLLVATVLAVTAFGLVGCESNDDSSGSGGSSDKGAASGQTKPAADGSSSNASDGGPDAGCETPKLEPGHKIVQPVEHPKQDTMQAKDTKFVCDPNDGHYEGVGSPKFYMFSHGDVKANVVSNGPGHKSVVVGELWNHISDCLEGGTNVKPPMSCSANGVYDIKLNGDNEITEITEVWHP